MKKSFESIKWKGKSKKNFLNSKDEETLQNLKESKSKYKL